MGYYNICEVCGRYGAEKHHIVFRKQGGLDYDLNFKDLCVEHHRGNKSPHKDRKIDLCYKRELQEKLFNIFVDYDYSIEEVSELIGCKKEELNKLFKIVLPNNSGRYESETVVRVLMGGKLY